MLELSIGVELLNEPIIEPNESRWRELHPRLREGLLARGYLPVVLEEIEEAIQLVL